jgi:hypothetical protein
MSKIRDHVDNLRVQANQPVDPDDQTYNELNIDVPTYLTLGMIFQRITCFHFPTHNGLG